MANVFFALGLHMHQPPENLRLLLETNDWEAQQIIRCYDRAVRFAYRYKGRGCFQIGFSGVLLEQLLDRDIIDRYRRFVDIPEMLQLYRGARNIEIIGMGYYHPIFPLIPPEDWDEQLRLGRSIVTEVFGQNPKGFWPSEMAFSMEMVPALKRAGYEYVVVDHVHVKPRQGQGKADCFQPYLATYGGESITVVPRNRDVSNAQESGMDAQWFINEVNHKMKDYPSTATDRLITTWSDGENGGWFRQMDEASGFYGHFLAPFLERVENGATNIAPTLLSEYLRRFPAQEEAEVQTGAWNVAATSGLDFSQWDGSELRKGALAELFRCSALSRDLARKGKGKSADAAAHLQAARKLILEAQTSCYLFWGDEWVPKLFSKLEQAKAELQHCE